MSDQLPISLQSALPAGTKSVEVNIPGDNHTIIAHAQKVENTVMVLMEDPRHRNQDMTWDSTLNLDYYHLFVIGNESFEDNCFIVPKDRAISESTSPELIERYGSLTEEAINELKTFPAIFASENHMYGKTDEEQDAYYGFVLDVKIQDNGIKIYFKRMNRIRQQRLNEMAYDLGIKRAKSFNELNRTHWAIKRINLVEVLRKVGISVYIMS